MLLKLIKLREIFKLGTLCEYNNNNNIIIQSKQIRSRSQPAAVTPKNVVNELFSESDAGSQQSDAAGSQTQEIQIPPAAAAQKNVVNELFSESDEATQDATQEATQEVSGSHLDLSRAPYVSYGVKYIGLVSLDMPNASGSHLDLSCAPCVLVRCY